MIEQLKNPYLIALISVLATLCLVVQLTPRPPNVEFTSLFTFTMGFMFGSLTGVLFGGFIMFVNGFFSPWGLAGLNMPFQMLGMGIVGLAGGLYRRHLWNYNSAKFCAKSSVLGAFLTVIYDFITNVGVAMPLILCGMNPTWAIITTVAWGAPFSLIHTYSNIAVFGVAFFPLVKALNHFGGEKLWLKREQSHL